MTKKTVALPANVQVGAFAEKLEMPVTDIIGQLMKNGIMATVNESIDRETAEIIASEYDVEIIAEEDEKRHARKIRSKSDTAETRPPIVAIMGHVDHGKTSLLDAIREANTTEAESGGITQHISAYQIEHDKRKITFLDTPGHEAFAALREHGAQITDVAVIVVAADDGVKPQTKEAISFARKAGVKLIVAINKIDKAGADLNKVKQQLADLELMSEEWGGETVTVEVSAQTKVGLDKLVEMILLVSDVEELQGDATGNAEGIIIESHMETGKGPVATALVEHGELNKGDYVVAGSSYAKVRTLSSYDGKEIDAAGPSTPVIITGFKDVPSFGDVFLEVNSEKEARQKAQANKRQSLSNVNAKSAIQDNFDRFLQNQETSELNVVIKADVAGSLQSITDSLAEIGTEEVKANVVGSSVGEINENDIQLAKSSNAVILGFHTSIPVSVKKAALREGVSIRLFEIIYELLDEAKQMLSQLLSDEVIEEEIGKLKIKGVFRTTRNQVICGGQVTSGKVEAGLFARLLRDKEKLAETKVEEVKREAVVAKEVFEGEMCGLSLATEGKLLVKEGDVLEFFSRETRAREL